MKKGSKSNRYCKSSRSAKTDIYEKITAKIIAQLEKGVAPWRCPFLREVGFPKSFSTGNHYRGINVFLLSVGGFPSPYWLTYRQAQSLGGHVRKGETGSPIIKYGTYEVEEAEPESGEPGSFKRGYLKGFTVFNATQIEGIEFPPLPSPPARKSPPQIIESAEAIICQMESPPAIKREGADIPHYSPTTDAVGMPAPEQFESDEDFYHSLFHELIHSTGHESRLNRDTLTQNKGAGSVGEDEKIYSLEELVAEMGAAFLSAHAGIQSGDTENSAAYLQGWLSVLKAKDNKRWLISAAASAQKAADYILGTSNDDNPKL